MDYTTIDWRKGRVARGFAPFCTLVTRLQYSLKGGYEKELARPAGWQAPGVPCLRLMKFCGPADEALSVSAAPVETRGEVRATHQQGGNRLARECLHGGKHRKPKPHPRRNQRRQSRQRGCRNPTR